MDLIQLVNTPVVPLTNKSFELSPLKTFIDMLSSKIVFRMLIYSVIYLFTYKCKYIYSNKIFFFLEIGRLNRVNKTSMITDKGKKDNTVN